MGNDQSYCVTGSSSIKFKLWDDTYRTLDNVRLVPNLRRNLISLGMLDKGGCSYRSENGVLRVMKGFMLILKGILNHGLYTLQGEAIKADQALACKSR